MRLNAQQDGDELDLDAVVRFAAERATGHRPMLPARVGDLFAREERYTTLPADYAAVTGFIAERATPSAGFGR